MVAFDMIKLILYILIKEIKLSKINILEKRIKLNNQNNMCLKYNKKLCFSIKSKSKIFIKFFFLFILLFEIFYNYEIRNKIKIITLLRTFQQKFIIIKSIR